MTDSKVSKRYASSLLDVAIEKKNLSTIIEDMELILNTLQQSKDLRKMLLNPIIKHEVKATILKEVFSNKVNPDSMIFLNFILEKNREMVLEDILVKFMDLKNEYLGIVEIEVKTATQFTQEQVIELKSTFEYKLKKKVKFIFRIDPSVIGGFVAKVKDTLYDASVKHQLEILKKQLLQGSVSLN